MTLFTHRADRWYRACIKAATRWLTAGDVPRMMRVLEMARQADSSYS